MVVVDVIGNIDNDGGRSFILERVSREAREMDEYTSEPSGEGADGRCSRYYIRASEP